MLIDGVGSMPREVFRPKEKDLSALQPRIGKGQGPR